MKKINLPLLSVCSIVLLSSGCMVMKKETSPPAAITPVNVFNFEGVPSEDYYVGGGFIIRYRAHKDGILYISEDESKRLLGTISMTAGEKYEVVYDINDADMAKNMKIVGIDPAKALIKVYFVPREHF